MEFTIKSLGFIIVTLGLLTSCVNKPRQASSTPSHTNIPEHKQSGDNNAQSVINGLSDTSAGYLCSNPQNFKGRVIGDGHCVSLIKHCSNAPNTVDWRAGKRVVEQSVNAIAPGTIIATFKNGRYPSRHGYHAAIYIKHDAQGIWVWDQWRGKPVHQRLIRMRHDKAYSSNSAQDYRIVKRIIQ